jgi:hemoglobin
MLSIVYRQANKVIHSMNTPYQILGEDGLRNLSEAFYTIMDELDEAKNVRAMHAESLEPMKEKLYEYLTGWMGGPALYAEHHGSVCMTTPHKHYVIGPKERDQWLLCMDKALERIEASEELVTMLKEPMFRIADAIRNSENSEPRPQDDNMIAIG